MLGIDIDRLTHAVTQPFAEILADFNKQMDNLHHEMREHTELLCDIRKELSGLRRDLNADTSKD